MLLKKSAIAISLLVLFTISVTLSASATSAANLDKSSQNIKPGNGGYVVTVGQNAKAMKSPTAMGYSSVYMCSMSDYISQGQTKDAYKTIGSPVDSFGADLYWGNPSNSLSLTVITPDKYILGAYYDNIDGMLNGDIPICISRNGGVATGTYTFLIYGDKVGGRQYFTFS